MKPNSMGLQMRLRVSGDRVASSPSSEKPSEPAMFANSAVPKQLDRLGFLAVKFSHLQAAIVVQRHESLKVSRIIHGLNPKALIRPLNQAHVAPAWLQEEIPVGKEMPPHPNDSLHSLYKDSVEFGIQGSGP